jgi:hypothetical protein
MGNIDSSGGDFLMAENPIDVLEARLNSLEGKISRKIESELKKQSEELQFLSKKIMEISEMSENLSAMAMRISDVERNYLDGKIQEAGFGLLAAKMDDLIDVVITATPTVLQVTAPTQQVPSFKPPQPKAPTQLSYGGIDLEGILWKDGQWGTQYVYSEDCPELLAALQRVGGKYEFEGYTYSVGKDLRYINKRPPKKSSGQSTTQQPQSQGQGIDPKGAWTNDPITEGQIQFMQKLEVAHLITPGMTKGEASQIIEEAKKAKGWK